MASYSYRDNSLAPAVAVALLSIVLAGCASQQEKADEPQQEEVPSSSPSSSSAEQPAAEQSEADDQSAAGDRSQSESDQGESDEGESSETQAGEGASQQQQSAQGESEQGESGKGTSGEQSSDADSEDGSAESAGSEVGQPASGNVGSEQTAGSAGQTAGAGGQTAGDSGVTGGSADGQESAAGSSGAYGGSSDGSPGIPMGTGDTADLDRILNESLGDFDGTMAAEQEILAASGQGSAQSAGERESKDATAVVSAGSGSPPGGVPEQEGIYGGGVGSDGGDSGTESSAGAQDDGLTEEQRRERIPADIPSDGTGEDVVAGQIREMAMQEEDPELREAIWDEYRNHTGMKK